MTFLERTKGMPYGGIPYTEILSKLEETDIGDSNDVELHYDNYIRSEIVDNTLDAPFLESDHTRRDDSISKSILNLRYNGSRGEYAYPRHPEMFVGFTDRDPRGVENNPRMNQMQDQITTRMPNLEIRMGHNSDHHDTQRPWTNQSLSKCRVDLQNALSYNTKIFIDEKDGRAMNQNILQTYDHNKKGLIYKDNLPETLDHRHQVPLSNTNYTVSSVPFISHDNIFSLTYDNEQSSKLIPKKTRMDRNQCNDNVYPEPVEMFTQKTSSYKQDFSINNAKQDQIIADGYDMIPINGKLMQYTSNVNNKIYTDHPYIVEFDHMAGPKNHRINNITNPALIMNEMKPVTFTDNVVRKYNDKFLINDLTLIQPDHMDNIQFDNNNIYKNNNMLCGQNNIFINSSFLIPEYNFNDLPSNKNSINLNNNMPTFRDLQQSLYQETDTVIKHNPYQFTDNISMITNNTNTDMSISDVHDIETAIKLSGKYQQENKVSSSANDNVWNISDENDSVSKSQKLQRTSATDDPIVVNVQDTPDYESFSGGIGLGNKHLRADYIDQEEELNDAI